MESMSILIIPAENQRECFYDPDVLAYKQDDTVTISVKKVGADYATPTAYLLGALFIISIPTVALLILFWIRKHQKEEEVELEPEDVCSSPAHDLNNVCLNSAHDLDQVDATVDADGRNSLRRRSTQILPELLRHFLSDPLHRYLRSDAYYHVVPLLVVFYCIPSFQLVFLTVESNSEACYFNFGCARPWWIFKAFNHIFSNLGYIWFGLCFMLLVWIKSRYFKERPAWQHGKKKRGLPQQYGLYYAMGLATVAQGLLSATFHICPSNMVSTMPWDSQLWPKDSSQQPSTSAPAIWSLLCHGTRNCGPRTPLSNLPHLPQQYGLYYAMGLATVAQGLLSATFH